MTNSSDVTATRALPRHLSQAADAVGALEGEQARNEECRRIAIFRALKRQGVTTSIVRQALAIEARLGALGDVAGSSLMAAYLASPARSRSALLRAAALTPLVYDRGVPRFENDLFFLILSTAAGKLSAYAEAGTVH